MSQQITRTRRLRKKLHLDEFAILGFEFSFTLRSSADEQEQFLNSLAALADTENLFISLGNDNEMFEGAATSADRYGNATEANRAALETLLKGNTKVTDAKVGALVDACYEM